MARSYKKEVNRWYRHPRGRRQALGNGTRPKAVPPDAWEDVPPDAHCKHADKVASALHKKGWSDDDIVNHLVRRYGYERWRVLDMYWCNSRWWRCDCEQCVERRRM